MQKTVKFDDEGTLHVIHEEREGSRTYLKYGKYKMDKTGAWEGDPPITVLMQCKCGYSSKFVGDWFAHECKESETNGY